MKYAALILLAFLQVVLSIVLSSKKRSRTSRWFTIFAICLAIFTVFNVSLDYYQYSGLGSVKLLSTLNRLAFMAGIICMICAHRLTLIFPVEKKIGKQEAIVVVVGLWLAVISLVPSISGTFYYSAPGQPASYTYGSSVLLVGLYSIILILLSTNNMLSAYRNSTDKKIKHQTVTIFTALALAVLYATIFIIILPALYPTQGHIVFIGYFAPYIFTAVLLYNIFTQGFLNFRSVIARTFAYVLSLGLLGFAYGFVAFVLIDSILFKEAPMSVTQRRVAYTLLALVFGLSFSPAKKAFDRLSNNLFYRDSYDPQGFIDQLNDVLVSTTDMAGIAKQAACLIETTIKASNVRFLILDGDGKVGQSFSSSKEPIEEPLKRKVVEAFSEYHEKVVHIDEEVGKSASAVSLFEKNDARVIIRLVTRRQKVGFLVIGTKKSGNDYTDKDMQVFSIIADQLAIAIQNALRYREIEKFNETLQNEVDDATSQLRRTNEKLKALDEAKDEFISMASHQLRTPLTSVKGYISMVLDGDAGELNEQQHKLLEQSFISSQRMVYLIADLLNVSRLRTGKFIIEPAPTDLPQIIAEEVSQLQETAAARGLKIFYDKPAQYPTLNLDETKTRQVVMNFLDNAIYYTPAGGKITITLSTTGSMAELRIADTGLGVPKGERHHLFTKFYRASNAKRARPDGTGLGLFMAKKVIVAQGGAVIFTSEEGKGSTFGFSFPLSKLGAIPKKAG